MVRLTDRPDMTLGVYRGRKTTIQYNTTTPMQDYLSEACGNCYKVYGRHSDLADPHNLAVSKNILDLMIDTS